MATVTRLVPTNAITLRAAADDFCDQVTNAHTRKACAIALDRVAAELGPGWLLADVDGAEIGAVLEGAWGTAAVVFWLALCRRRGDVAPELLAAVRAERPPTLPSMARSRTAIDRLISGRAPRC